jgi:hypothetical protein
MKTATTPGPTISQESGNDPSGSPILSVLVKATYSLHRNGSLAWHPEQIPLERDGAYDPEIPDRLVQDLDIYPYKPYTDLIIQGHAHNLRKLNHFDLEVAVGRTARRIRAIGDRWVTKTAAGRLAFSEPLAFERIPLQFTHAYGGRDLPLEEHLGPKLAEWFGRGFTTEDIVMGLGSPAAYPRNPIGRGYLLTHHGPSVESTWLPNLEDPDQLLTPDNLVVDRPQNWPRMPLPRATEWLQHGWFPRCGYLARFPWYEEPKQPLTEVVRGWAETDIAAAQPRTARHAFRFLNGAAPGFQYPHLQPGESIGLTGMHPLEPRVVVKLPSRYPKIWVDGRKGTLKETETVLHTVVIEPDRDRVSLVWRGSAHALRPYLPDELTRMPLKVEWN